jgi:hypothetical protein
MMRESRQGKQEEVERLRHLLQEARSPPYWPEEEPVLDDPAKFDQELEEFIAPLPTTPAKEISTRPFFDLHAYRRHLLDRVQGCVVQFDGFPLWYRMRTWAAMSAYRLLVVGLDVL